MIASAQTRESHLEVWVQRIRTRSIARLHARVYRGGQRSQATIVVPVQSVVTDCFQTTSTKANKLFCPKCTKAKRISHEAVSEPGRED